MQPATQLNGYLLTCAYDIGDTEFSIRMIHIDCRCPPTLALAIASLHTLGHTKGSRFLAPTTPPLPSPPFGIFECRRPPTDLGKTLMNW